MAIPFLNKLKKSTPQDENLLSLTLTPNKVLANVWNFANGQVNVLAFSHKNFNSVENLPNEAAVAIDDVAEASKTDVTKVVFGLSSYWFEEGDLSHESSKILKDLAKDLDLEAQAYVSLATSINHFYKMEHGVTPHAVLLGIFENQSGSPFVEAHLTKNGQVLKTLTSKAEISLENISALIKKLKAEEDLPSKIIIYGTPNTHLIEKLESHKWGETFVQEPKIDKVTEQELAKSVSFAQAADILGHDPVVKQNREPKGEEPEKNNTDDFGFVENEDILASSVKDVPPPEVVKPKEPEVSYDNLRPPVFDEKDYAVEITPQQQAPASSKSHNPKSAGGRGFHFPKFSLPNIPFTSSPKKLAIVAGIIVLLLIGGIFIAGQTLTNAQVIIKVSPHSQQFDFTAKVIANGANDFGQGEIAGRTVTGNASGSQKGVASGSKKTGNSAKGQVKILNWDKSSDKTFSSGTQLITNDGLKFTTDSEVNVASRSATAPGENKIAATAADIGTKYNISSGTDLTIVGFDEVFYSGVTDSAFSGGDEKQITVASKDDLDKLEKTLTQSLTEKAKTDLQSKASGLKLYDESKVVKVIKKSFDKKVDDEASLINLDMSVDYEGVVFEENDLKKYLAEQANKKIEGNQETTPENIEIKDIKVDRNKDILTITGKYDAGLVPKINEDDLKSKIAGKSVKDARAQIKQLQDVSDVIVNFSPSIPFIDSIPGNKSKITIKIESS